MKPTRPPSKTRRRRAPDHQPLLSKSERDAIVVENMGFIYVEARWWHRVRPDIPIADLAQEGMIGAMRAAETFDPSLGFKFTTYASRSVWNAMQRYVDYHHVVSGMGNPKRTRKSVEYEEARRTALEAPVRLNVKPPRYDDARGTRQDRLVSTIPGPEDLADAMSRIRFARSMLTNLTEKERDVVESWMNDEMAPTIAQRYGQSRERIRQIREETFAKIRERPDVRKLLCAGESP